ncbi:MAG: nitrate reductase NapA, partial [Candidatus Marinamargulisbacteria bacterium]
GGGNKGLLCVKGYNTIKTLYGQDRLKKAQIRKNGKMVEVPLEEALTLVADKMKSTIKDHGKDAVSMYGSGQWAIVDGYAASKFMKGGIGTNNLEANARLCMASAVRGFLTTFGLDEPNGCYQDLDIGNTFVLWSNNMSEMHPVLYSRMLENKRKNKKVKIIDLTTRYTRTSQFADKVIYFNPQSDLAIANGILKIIIDNGWQDDTFLEKHVLFKEGLTNIGYGLEDGFKFKDKPTTVTKEKFLSALQTYTPEYVAEIAGVSAEDLHYLASLYGSPETDVVSFWCMGVNQHTRGTWMNNLIHNIHLVVGKTSRPGNHSFSLTGQPSACGTVREVGTLTHKLPHGVVMNKSARELAAKIWKVPVERIDPKPTYHTVAMFRALDAGKIKFMWIQCTNPMVTMPKLKRYRDAALKADRFIVVSDIYPTPTTEIADVILPAAMWIEREGLFGNSERRTQQHDKLVDPPGDAISDMDQIIRVARKMGMGNLFDYPEKTMVRDLYEEYRLFHAGHGHDMAPYKELKKQPGLIWPYIDGKEVSWRYNEKYDPTCKPGSEFDFYGNKKSEHRAHVWIRPYEPPPESPDKAYPFWLCTGRVLEHWHSGSMTRRVPELHQAVPYAYCEMNPEDAVRLGVKDNDVVKLTTRRGSIKLTAFVDRRARPISGHVFVPFFDENNLINELTLDAFCPISKQPDYKKCAVKLEKA